MRFDSLIPELSVTNLENSKKFYIDILGFKQKYECIEDKFIFISLGEAQIMLEQINGHWETGRLCYPFGRGVNFQIEVDEVQILRDKLLSNGFTLFRDIVEVNYKENEIIRIKKELLV